MPILHQEYMLVRILQENFQEDGIMYTSVVEVASLKSFKHRMHIVPQGK